MDPAIVSIKGNDYRIHFLHVSKEEFVSIMNKTDFEKKKILVKNKNIYIFLFLHKRWIIATLIIKEIKKDC